MAISSFKANAESCLKVTLASGLAHRQLKEEFQKFIKNKQLRRPSTTSLRPT